MRISGRLATSAALALTCAGLALAPAGAAERATAHTVARPNITLDAARKVIDAARAEAVENNWQLTFTIVDAAGRLVLFERMDESPLGTIEVSQGKALTAVKFRAPTKMVQDMVSQGGAAMLTLGEITAVSGGYPIMIDGKLVGAIGVSGGLRGEDDLAAAAGLEVLEQK